MVFRKIIPYVSASTLAHRGTPISRCCIPTTAKNHAKPGQPVCARARPLSLVSEFVTLKEVYRWFLSRAEPLRASDGTLLQWVGVNLDIEELKCTEQALRESEYKLRQIIETVPGLVWSNGPDGEPTHINQRMLDYSGMRFEDFKHRGWEAFVHPADFPETAKAFYHAIQTGTSYEGVMRLRRADGEFRWHHARCEPLRDRQGRIIQWYGLSVDIDERKKAEDRLRRSEAYLAEAQRLSHTGTCGLQRDNDGLCLLVGRELTESVGFDPLQGVPSRETIWQRIHPDDRDRVYEEVERGSAPEKRLRRSSTESYCPMERSNTSKQAADHLFSASGELVEVVGTHVDVTERKRAEQALRESEGEVPRLRRNRLRLVLGNRSGLQIHAADRECFWFTPGRSNWHGVLGSRSRP